MDKILIRDACPSDINFVFATWLQAYRRSEFARRIPHSIYYAAHHLAIEGILRRGKCSVACSLDDADSIFGYLVYEMPATVHALYVKQTFRRLGVARDLMAEAKIDPNKSTFTHLFPRADWALIKYPGATYNPYAL